MRTPGLVLAAVLAAVAAAGCGVPAAKPAAAAAVTHHGGTTHITAWSVNSDGPRLQAVLAGAVGDYGPAVAVRPGGPAGTAHGSELELNLSRGGFRLSIAGDRLQPRQGISPGCGAGQAQVSETR